MSLPSDPTGFSAREAAAAIRDRRLSSVELTEACLGRAAERDEAVRAWVHLDPDAARAEAGARDRERSAGGALRGVPVGVKDIVATADMPTGCGSPIFEGTRPRADAACVAALRAEGGLVLGKTRTTEFAAYTPTVTRNPLDPGHTPGGSSSGSAAAVADRQAPLAIGTQTAGSVVRPASFCGIVGYKPTFGTIDFSGVRAFAASLDTLGVFARRVDDAALFAGAMAGWPELAAPTRVAPPRRVRVVRAPAWERATPEADRAVTDAARRLEEAGAAVEEMAPPEGFEALAELQDVLQIYEGRRALAWERLARPDALSAGLRRHFDRAAKIGFDGYVAARRAQTAWRSRMEALVEPGDVLLTASAPGEAPEGLESTGDPIFCRAWTFLHMPCLSLPAGRGPRGLPLGVQLIGPLWGDLELLAAAACLEERLFSS